MRRKKLILAITALVLIFSIGTLQAECGPLASCYWYQFMASFYCGMPGDGAAEACEYWSWKALECVMDACDVIDPN